LAKGLNEGGQTVKARQLTILGATLAALAPNGGLVLAVVTAGPVAIGPSPTASLVALTGVAGGHAGLLMATRRWPTVFKIIAVLVYSLSAAADKTGLCDASEGPGAN